MFSWTSEDFSHHPPSPCAGSSSSVLSCFLTLDPCPLRGTRSPPGTSSQPAASLVPPSSWALHLSVISKTDVSQFGCLRVTYHLPSSKTGFLSKPPRSSRQNRYSFVSQARPSGVFPYLSSFCFLLGMYLKATLPLLILGAATPVASPQ